MSTAFTIRAAARDDLPSITAIYAEEVRHGTATFELEPPDLAEMARRHAALSASGHPYIVAEAEGMVLGYAYAGPYRPRPAYRFAVEDSIYLAPSARGKGVGRALLGALIAASEARGYRQMIAVIGDSANTASIALHAGAGFALTGTFREIGWKFGRWLDTVLMQRALGPGSGMPAE
jgi:phosphinothricin acetyltransferase